MHAILAIVLAAGLAPRAAQEEVDALPAFSEFMVIGDVASRGRRADHVDAIELQIVRDEFSAPIVVESVGGGTWSRIEPDDQGAIQHPDLRGDVAPVPGRAQTLKLLPQLRPHRDDASRHRPANIVSHLTCFLFFHRWKVLF